MNAGITIQSPDAAAAPQERAAFFDDLVALGLTSDHLDWRTDDAGLHVRLHPEAWSRWTPGSDTLDLHQRGLPRRPDGTDPPGGDAAAGADADTRALLAEIVVALLASPIPIVFPSLAEWASALRMRLDIVHDARRTTMDFHTDRVDRPEAYWRYDEDSGFVLRPGSDLVEALVMATQPAVSGRQYAFSCYRATEYVLLLAIAREARRCHPALYRALQAQWTREAVASGRFHDSFLHEWGSNDEPLPPTWYVPGDRVWFRNPDEASSDAAGFEGSWVVYLGRGGFANFWKPDQPFTLTHKCVEVYHWRHGTYRGGDGELHMDEAVVEQHVARTLADPQATAAILARMQRYKDRRGVYADGGCLDTTRESPRWVRPGSCDIVLPSVAITGD